MERAPHDASDPDRQTEAELKRYASVIAKRKWVVLATIAAAIAIAVLYTMQAAKVYEATASIVVNPTPPQVFGSQVQEVIQLGAANSSSNQEYYNTQIDILTGFELAKTTVSHENLYRRVVPPLPGETMTDAERIDRAAAVLNRTLRASQNRESQILQIHVQNGDPELAADLANEHVKSYIEFTRSLRTNGSGEISKFLATELKAAEKALHESEEKLYAYKKDNAILSVSLEDRQNILSADIARFDSALTDARIKRIELGTVKSRAEKLAGDDLLESPLFALASNAGVVDALKEQYVREQQKFIEIEEDLGPRHPEYLKQQAKVKGLYDLIGKEATRAQRELNERYQAAVSAENQFSGELERLKTDAQALGPKTIEFNRLQRQHASDEQSYTLMLGRLRDSELSQRNEQINVRDHEHARGAVLAFPRVKLDIAIGAMLGLLLGIGLAVALEFADRTVKSAADVEVAARAPVLGLVPILSDLPDGDSPAALQTRDLYVFTHPQSRAAEYCRSIRTNLLFSGADRELKVLTLTSPNPREGKSTLAIYMGTTMAQSGQRVLLVDSDMRRPRLHKSLGASRTIGLSNLMVGESSLDDCIKATDVPNLFLLPCGPTPPNPVELLLSKRFEQLLVDLRGRFDRIILDSPPLQQVTDAAVLARRSDGAVLVVKAGRTQRDELARSAKQLHDVNANVVGVILNDLDVSDRGYGYYYGEDTKDAKAPVEAHGAPLG
jgi:capsular exopolysaccharide synthesis family protein